HGLVLFGGRDGSNRYLNDTWLFNGSGWTNLTGVGPAPSGRGVHDSLAYDAADGYVLLFGGFSASGYHEDTWTFANGTWSNISASLSAAPPGASYRAAYDAISHDAVFYGSAGACTGPAYTWTYSAGTWTNRTPATGGPTASAGAGAIAYDPILGGVLINGGYDTTCTVTDQSWLFQNGTWSDISNVSSTTPPGRWDAQMVFDDLLTGDLLFSGNEATHGGSAALGSDTWGFLDGLRVAITANTSLGPIPLAVGLSLSGPPGGTGPYTYAWTFGDGTPSTYGSSANHTYTTPGSYPVSLEVNDSSGRWGWGFATVTATPPILGSWTNISAGAGTPPTPRAAFGMAYDPLLSAIVVFGGIDTNNVILGDTWEFKDGRWSQPTLAGAPPARVQLAMVYDPQEQGIILFGGRAANYTFYNDTWLFNASGWTHLSPAGPAPSPRSVDGSMTYDAGDGYLLLLGGWSLATGGLTDTWSFANGTWTNRTAHVSTSPPYAAYRGAYDAHDGYAVYFGSPGSCTGPAYTWTYAAGTWTNRTASAGSPRIQAGAGDMDYDPIEGAIVVSGGYDASCYVTNQTYLFTDGAWSDVTGLVGVNPPGRWDAGSAFDGALTGNVVWGGNEELKGGSNNFEGTTWAFEDGLTAAPTASPTEGVAPLTVSFGPGPSLGGTPPYRYNWSFGDGSANATIADPTHTYSSPGSYTVDLVVNDSAGRFGSGAIALTVYAPIGVAVSVTPEAGEAPLTATFGVVATGGVPSLSYTWAFGDGNSSTARNTTHTYTRGGPYNWTLTVVDALGDRNETNGTIEVAPALAVSAAASTQAGSYPLTVNFTGSVTGGAGPFRYAWSFGDGAIGPNASAASHTYTATGSFPAAFNVTDSDGVTRTATLTIVVVPPVSAGGSATPLVGIAPLTVEFTTVPSGGEAP
ncbi:MAG TPA: PKD domain-containing protein, partial [Thermoplasmata archaeon]|nr:PKD domain-containing protein [Thermoplasmata archaeon]